jgi:hypothetical protein
VAAVIGFGLDQCQRRAGEYRVVAPGREQLADAGVAVAACLVYPLVARIVSSISR